MGHRGVLCASVLSHPTPIATTGCFLPMEVQDGASTDTGSRIAVPRAWGDARIGVKVEEHMVSFWGAESLL